MPGELTPPDGHRPPRRTPFEWSLKALDPQPSQANRPSFMYKAGRASRDREVRFWQVAAIFAAASSVGLSIALFVFVGKQDEPKSTQPKPLVPYIDVVPSQGQSSSPTESGELNWRTQP